MKIVKDGQFYRLVWKTAIPVILQNLITVGVNIMDTVMLSQMGEAQISASSLANSFISIYQITAIGIGIGASILTARYWGGKDGRRMKQVVALTFRIVLLYALIFTMSAMLFSGPIMRLYATEEDVISYGVLFFRWCLPTFLLVGVSFALTQILRSVQQHNVPLIAAVAAFFFNIFFNYIFIFGKLGAPRMEIAGAALGTVIARFVEFAIIAGYFFLKDRKISFGFQDFFLPVQEQISLYFRVSIPVIISDLLLALGENAVAIIMGHIGKSFVAANSIVAIVSQCMTRFTGGVSNASCMIIGNSIGRGEYDRLDEEGNAFVVIGAAFGVIGALGSIGLADIFIGFFKVTNYTAALAKEMMFALAIIVFFQCVNSILSKGVLRGGGDTCFLMVADNLFMWSVAVPLGILAGWILDLPAFWTFLFLRCDQILKAFLCYRRLHSKKWLKIFATPSAAEKIC